MNTLFDYYIPSIGKRPLGKIKENDGSWLSEPPKTGDYVGILKDGIIQIDIDDKEQSEIAYQIVKDKGYKCDVIQTTRGKHFIFRNTDINICSTGIWLAVGLQADIGIGGKNRVVPLRVTTTKEVTRIVDGVETKQEISETVDRQFLQTYSELDELPLEFRPVDFVDRQFLTSTTRNSDLFSYILILQNKGIMKKDIRGVLKTINDYVFPEPLSDRELDMITRDDAFSDEIFYDGKKFLHDRFGEYLLSNGNVVRINEQINIYTRNKIYSSRLEDFERMMVDKIPSLKTNTRKEIYEYMNLKCDINADYTHPKYIGLRDYVLDLENMDVFPYNPRFIIQNKIAYNYNENAYHELMDKTLDKIVRHDKSLRMLLEEMVGYTLYRENTMQKGFILTGVGANGKSTFLNMIKKLLGDENYTAISIQELEKTFEPAELHNKLANIGDDISPEFLNRASTFKKAVTGETFQVQRKFGHPFMLKNYSKQIFCANELPPVADRSDGFGRRLIIIPFNAKFTPQDPDYDPFIEDKLLTDEGMEYLLKLAVEGLKRVLFNRQFTTSVLAESEKAKYLRENNNVLQWLEEEPKVENESVASTYQEYNIWTSMNGFKSLNRTNFGKEMAKVGWISVPVYQDGTTVRIYKKEGEN